MSDQHGPSHAQLHEALVEQRGLSLRRVEPGGGRVAVPVTGSVEGDDAVATRRADEDRRVVGERAGVAVHEDDCAASAFVEVVLPRALDREVMLRRSVRGAARAGSSGVEI